MNTPLCDFGAKATDFELLGTDGKMWTLKDCQGKNGTLIMFICNHCPYVRAIQSLLVRDSLELLKEGVKSVAIMSNDTTTFPDDSYENMKKIAMKFNYSFPYLLDDSQDIAKAYGATCTPDFFGYNRNMELQYRGRLDETTPSHHNPESIRELLGAMQQISQTSKGPKKQNPSIGCSIKWRE